MPDCKGPGLPASLLLSGPPMPLRHLQPSHRLRPSQEPGRTFSSLPSESRTTLSPAGQRVLVCLVAFSQLTWPAGEAHPRPAVCVAASHSRSEGCVIRLERVPGPLFLIFHRDGFKEPLHAHSRDLCKTPFFTLHNLPQRSETETAQFLPYKNHEFKQVQLKEVIWQLRT